MLQYIDWEISPVLIEIFGREIRWYGLLFACGFGVGYWVEEKIFKFERLEQRLLEKMFTYVFFATVIGARLGHCLFYDFSYYMANPIEILKIWEGGLASHGGAIGIIIAMWYYSKKVSHRSFLWGMDRLVVPVPLVGALIRMGNLFNHEIYGHETTLPWGFRFIENINHVLHGVAPVMTAPSHPTQIYEALCYLVTFAFCLFFYFKRQYFKREGFIFGVFLIGIFLSRFIIEFLKNNQEDFENGMLLNMGQLLSVPFVILGVYLIVRSLKKRQI